MQPRAHIQSYLKSLNVPTFHFGVSTTLRVIFNIYYPSLFTPVTFQYQRDLFNGI